MPKELEQTEKPPSPDSDRAVTPTRDESKTVNRKTACATLLDNAPVWTYQLLVPLFTCPGVNKNSGFHAVLIRVFKRHLHFRIRRKHRRPPHRSIVFSRKSNPTRVADAETPVNLLV